MMFHSNEIFYRGLPNRLAQWLAGMIQAAQDRVAPPPAAADDGWPGPVTEGAAP